jgi:hypothetical protein
MKYLFICFFLLPLVSFAQKDNGAESKTFIDYIRNASKDKTHKYILVNKIIPDKETAVAVAEPILFKIYGKEQIVGEKPYQVVLVEGYWVVSGTLPKGWLGGVFSIALSAETGKVIILTHGK